MEEAMKKLAILLALLAGPALAADCSLDPAQCLCVGVTYKDPTLSAPGDLTIRVFNWQRAGKRLNRRLLDQTLVFVFLSYESEGMHTCCEVIDNRDATAPYDNISMSWIEPDAGERAQLLIGQYDAAPTFGNWFLVTNGDATTAAEISFDNPVNNGQEATVLSGDSRGIPLSKNDTLINRARNNRGTALRNKILEGCPLP
jgi:hypothetical protein